MSGAATAASDSGGIPASGDSGPSPPATPAAAAPAFAAGVSTAATLASAVEQACDQALNGLSFTAPSCALLFTYRLGAAGARPAELLAARLPPGCAIVGCQGDGVIGAEGQPGSSLVDCCTHDPPSGPQQGVALLLGSLPGRAVVPFAAASAPHGPGARHKLGQPISLADAAADREALATWLALPADAEPASILLFCADHEPSMMSLPHPHGLLARLQRAWPGVVIQGGISAGSLHYRAPASSEEGTPSAAATEATNFCGLVVCKASGSGATPAPAPPFVSAALTLKTAEGADAVFAEVRLVEAAGEAFGMHPILGPQPVFIVDSVSADPQQLASLFNNEEQPGGSLPASSALIHFLLENPGGAELAFWAADRSGPGNYGACVRAGRPVVVMSMGLKQHEGLFHVYGCVLPLDLPAARAILDEGQHGPGKMLCAPWVLVQGGPAAKEVLEAELPTLLSRCPPAQDPAARAAARCALLAFNDSERGVLQRQWRIEREMATVHRLAPQVPLVGVYCPGIVGPNTRSNFCGLRCIRDGGAADNAARSDQVADGLAALDLQARQDEEEEEQQQRQQQQRFAAERSEVLSVCATLSLLAAV